MAVGVAVLVFALLHETAHTVTHRCNNSSPTVSIEELNEETGQKEIKQKKESGIAWERSQFHGRSFAPLVDDDPFLVRKCNLAFA